MKAMNVIARFGLAIVLSMIPRVASADDTAGKAQETGAVEVDQAPPAAPVPETQSPAPGTAYVWIPGHWAWNGRRHAWTSGHWELPPQTGLVWVPANWTRVGLHWRFVPGHWRVGSVVESRTPPTVERQWIPATYRRRGLHWVYSPGHWETVAR
jgi:hypothetical protein